MIQSHDHARCKWRLASTMCLKSHTFYIPFCVFVITGTCIYPAQNALDIASFVVLWNH